MKQDSKTVTLPWNAETDQSVDQNPKRPTFHCPSPKYSVVMPPIIE